MFALAFLPVLQAGRAALGGGDPTSGLVVGFLDDASGVGPPDRLALCFEAMVGAAAALGLEMNPLKCELWARSSAPVPAAFTGAGREVPVSREGVVLLGCPLGSAAFVERHCQAWLATDGLPGVSELQHLEDAQAAFRLLRQCLIPRPLFLCRILALSPGLWAALEGFDDGV